MLSSQERRDIKFGRKNGRYDIESLLNELRIEQINSGLCTGTAWHETTGELLITVSPADGREIAGVRQATLADYELAIEKAKAAFLEWRKRPATYTWVMRCLPRNGVH